MVGSLRLGLVASLAALMATAVAAAPALDLDQREIVALREKSNAAIALHDAAEAVSVFLPDGKVIGSGGGLIQGADAMRAAFGQSFADANFITYVRDPVTVTVNGDTAAEQGRWRAVRRDKTFGGVFLARWAKTPEGWRIRSEMYVPLY
jgi:ketosteroid isomerase-like protein